MFIFKFSCFTSERNYENQMEMCTKNAVEDVADHCSGFQFVCHEPF